MSNQENTARSSTLFGNYDIIETVGHGGMGVVYRAHDTSLDRVVALKVLKDDLRAQKHVVARFQREAQAIASLNHPNIIHVYSVGSVGRIPYIAMEFIEGEPLNRIMQRERKLPWERALEIGEQVANALAAAHEAQIIHRDIKPGNIIVDENGRAIVTDFGVAKVLTAETQLTIDGSRLGTPQYMSPERCLNRPITDSSDIYSLGVVLFQLISGRLPYRAKDPVDLIRKIVSDPPSRLSEYVEVPEDVERLIAYMIEKNVEDRPGSAAEVAELIARVRNGEPLFEETGIGDAMEALRDSLSTPTSGFDHATPSSPGVTLADRAQTFWRELSPAGRTVVFTVALVAAAALAGLKLSDYLNADYAISATRGFDPSVARWHQPAAVAEFVDESPGVVTARLALPGFTVRTGGWMDRGDGVVLIDGIARSQRAGQSALCVVDPAERSASVCIPPVPTAKGAPLELVGFSSGETRSGSRSESFLFRAPDPEPDSPVDRIMAAVRPDDPHGDWRTHRALASPRDPIAGDVQPARIDTLAVSPDGETIAIAVSMSDAPESWAVAVRPARLRPDEPVYTVLSSQGPPISHIEFSEDAAKLLFVRELGQTQRALHVVSLGASPPKAWLLMQGDIEVRDGAIDPDGASVLVTMRGSGGPRELKVVDIETGAVKQQLGDAESAVWHPSGAYAVACAYDQRGQMQLWTIGTRYPRERRQLTFVEGGVSGLCAVSVEGDWAMSAVTESDTPTLVFAALTGER